MKFTSARPAPSGNVPWGAGLSLSRQCQLDILSDAVEVGEAPTTAAELANSGPGFWLSGDPPVGVH